MKRMALGLVLGSMILGAGVGCAWLNPDDDVSYAETDYGYETARTYDTGSQTDYDYDRYTAMK